MAVRAALRAAGVPAGIAEREAPLAEHAMVEFAITTQRRASMFLAQVLHESCRLVYFEEIASGQAYEGRRDLGNSHPGDGRRFKGRGPIQLTGRANYRWAGRLLGLDLEAHPELAAGHSVGWRIAALYWHSRGLNALADAGDFIGITRKINGGTNGLASRQHFYAVLRGQDCRPADAWAGYTAAEQRWIKEYDELKHEDRDPTRRGVLVREMRQQRKRIWRLAQPKARGGDGGGWDIAERRRRYHSLAARTR